MTQHKQSHRIKSHRRTSHHIALHQNRSHHHHGTAEGSFTAKTWFGHRAGRSPCAHSIGKFFLCYILLFSSETSAPGSPGNYLYKNYILLHLYTGLVALNSFMITAMGGVAHLHSLMALSPRWNINGFLLRECYGNRTFASVLDEIYRESRGTLTAVCPTWCGRSAAIFINLALFFPSVLLGGFGESEILILQNEMLDHLGYLKPSVDCLAPSSAF